MPRKPKLADRLEYDGEIPYCFSLYSIYGNNVGEAVLRYVEPLDEGR